MKRNIGIAVLTLSFSSFIQAAPSYGLDTAETMAHLVKMQKGSGLQSICTYRSVTQHYGVHEIQNSMLNGCEKNLAYIATSEGGGVLRVFGTTNRLLVKRLGYRPSRQAAPTVVSKYKRLCDNPNMSVSFNQKTGETTDCRTGEVTIDPQIKVLKEQGLWPNK